MVYMNPDFWMRFDVRKYHNFHSWLFDILVEFFVNSGWIIVVKDFKKSKKEKCYLGLTDYKKRTIFLDIDDGTPEILIHELGHLVLGLILDRMARKLPWKDLKNIKGKDKAEKYFNWEEIQIVEYTRLFYHCLSKRQIKILQYFIDDAKDRYQS